MTIPCTQQPLVPRRIRSDLGQALNRYSLAQLVSQRHGSSSVLKTPYAIVIL
ncbi:hypothetical protein HBI56_150260 [Parastagonospora nodorum]|uniref:Uncharacterized protein n=1 Tax=Phaeosphaeria nodorum (strain SN15 / ATCC MYA-4574 / FGSC 10173) TaxID=321614 RepID=A0A7U2FJD0_PHANO|nr:hypothetical protein HBH56_184260 [Parastagonospora nodorum]QRD04076.1 hypothetical protein JI435_420660 [Parastagonospora nodorum SN15]KAH3926205.1 hypothetical protein HBH54_173410 [Parastagonospora nodorum]KAH3944719.1 hypothetical protein HBH53_151520 [Parastagonospora nodorum]KAH3962479.1 hypothetical protein HBH52_224890 [Parastagonospora nodorum]